MSTIFEVPCPECGRSLSVADGGGLGCQACRRTYQSRMGHLFPVAERPASTTASTTAPTTAPTTAVPASRPAAAARS